MKKILPIFIVFVFLSIYGYSQYSPMAGQNNTCETAAPFCTGTTYTFPAGTSNPPVQAQTGPFYSCLLSTPNPAWYYMRVLNSGNLIISMHSEPAHDIDFCCWGPFTTQNACTQLTQPKVVSCSYSTASTETCNIPNGVSGQYYILIITNYSNQPCNIIFSQTSGTGTTDCTILPPPCMNNGPICAGQTLQLTANTVNGAQYRWSGPNNFHSFQQNPSIPNAQPVNSGSYYVNIMVNGTPSADSSRTIAYVYKPIAHAGNDTAINWGVFTTLHGHGSGGSGHFHYHWEPANKLVNPNLAAPTTVNLQATTIFTLTVTDDSASCHATDDVTVSIAGGPLGVGTTASPSTICAGATSQLQAVGSGGAGTYTYSWTGPGGFTSTIQSPTVQPAVTTVYSVTVSDGYNTSINTVTVNVNQLPVANAGADRSIPFGSYVYLSGTVTGGLNTYFYAWSPANKLVNANIQQPQTINLEATTVYSLIVTDLVTGCISNNTANVTIEVTGGALNVNPVATPDWICKGDSTQLHASAGGGNVGFYTYTWSSNPPGFSSTIAEPFVHPLQNTDYNISVNDGFNTTSGQTTISIYPQPVIKLGPTDTTVCIYSNVTLDAGNSGSQYLWTNGEITRTISIGTTGIGYDAQTYGVQVTNEHGCVSDTSITVIFSFAACTGIDEQPDHSGFVIYPNPSHGMVTIEMKGLKENLKVGIKNVQGILVADFVIAGQDGKTSISADLSKLPKGVYFVCLESANHVRTEKLVLE